MRGMGVRDGAPPCPSVQEAEGSNPAPRTVADGRAPADRTRTAPVDTTNASGTTAEKNLHPRHGPLHPNAQASAATTTPPRINDARIAPRSAAVRLGRNRSNAAVGMRANPRNRLYSPLSWNEPPPGAINVTAQIAKAAVTSPQPANVGRHICPPQTRSRTGKYHPPSSMAWGVKSARTRNAGTYATREASRRRSVNAIVSRRHLIGMSGTRVPVYPAPLIPDPVSAHHRQRARTARPPKARADRSLGRWRGLESKRRPRAIPLTRCSLTRAVLVALPEPANVDQFLDLKAVLVRLVVMRQSVFA